MNIEALNLDVTPQSEPRPLTGSTLNMHGVTVCAVNSVKLNDVECVSECKMK